VYELTTFLAVWGALLSSAMAGFELLRYLNRAKIDFFVGDGWISPTEGGRDEHLLFFRVSNIGITDTTIQNISIHGYQGGVWKWWPWKRSLPDRSAIFPSVPLPHVLSPGQVWSFSMPQDRIVKEFAKYQWIEFQLSHSMSKAPVRRLLAFKQESIKRVS
jgi:hypothetical protein